MSFATSAIALQGVGAASSVIGSYFGASSQKSTLEFNARLAELNALSQQTAMGYQASLTEVSAQGQKDTLGYQAAMAQLTAQDKKDTLGFDAGISDIKAVYYENKAQDELTKGERDAQTTQLKTAQIKGRQRATMAARGVDLGQGSAVDVLTSTDIEGAVAVREIQLNALRQAWGHRQTATTYQGQALLERAQSGAIDPKAQGDVIRTQANAIDPKAQGDVIRTQASGINPTAIGNVGRTQASGINPGMSALGTFAAQAAQLGASYSSMKKVGAFDTASPAAPSAPASSWWSPVPTNLMQPTTT